MKTSKTILATLVLSAVFAVSPATGFSAPDSKPPEKKTEKGAVKPYPLDVCIVTDNDLGSMGDEQVMIYEGQTIKFCCKPCEKKFLKNPVKYLEKLAPEKESSGEGSRPSRGAARVK